jgi:hypothetical protein
MRLCCNQEISSDVILNEVKNGDRDVSPHTLLDVLSIQTIDKTVFHLALDE